VSAAAAFGAPIPNFGGGGGVLKNPATAAARPARRRALVERRRSLHGIFQDLEQGV